MSEVQAVRSSIARVFSVLFVSAFVITLTGQFLPTVSADPGQVSTRSITMSSSIPSATDVTYTVTFTPATSVTNPDILIDFCSNDPLVGDTCTATAGTDVPNFSSATASTGWTISTIGSNRGVKLTTTTLSLTAGTPVTITLSHVTNPSNVATTGNNALGIFYGRILTYATGAAATDSANPGSSYKDYGGVAMTTAANINITSKVFETLSYCVFQGACGTAPQLALGDTTTGALSDTQAYVSSDAKYKIATNAANGATVVMRGNTLCRSGTASNCNTATANGFTITSIGTTEATSTTFATPAASTVGSEQFGMCVDTTGATGALAATATYADSVNSCNTGLTTGAYSGTSEFGFDDSTTDGTNSASGSTIMQSTGPIQSYTGTFSFLGNISTTTEAGIYTTSLNTVATGTF